MIYEVANRANLSQQGQAPTELQDLFLALACQNFLKPGLSVEFH